MGKGRKTEDAGMEEKDFGGGREGKKETGSESGEEGRGKGKGLAPKSAR